MNIRSDPDPYHQCLEVPVPGHGFTLSLLMLIFTVRCTPEMSCPVSPSPSIPILDTFLQIAYWTTLSVRNFISLYFSHLPRPITVLRRDISCLLKRIQVHQSSRICHLAQSMTGAPVLNPPPPLRSHYLIHDRSSLSPRLPSLPGTVRAEPTYPARSHTGDIPGYTQ